MIKEKHDKNSDNIKEEPTSSDKDITSNTDVRIKKEDDTNCTTTCTTTTTISSAATSVGNCPIKKEPGRPITKNGGIIGSTNIGSLQGNTEGKLDNEDACSTTDSTILTTTTTTTNVPLKTEDCLDSNDILHGDAFNLAGHQQSTPPEGIQPLASNVINKQQSSNMEVQYMQQQSQIFVFSTVLANSGADEVVQGRYPSIIAYHCAQPGTKKYLEKNPLKITQFNRQNPAQWLNNLAMMKNKGGRSPGLTPKTQPQQTIDNFLTSDGLDDMVGINDNDLNWDHKNHHHSHHQLSNLESVGNGLPDVVPDVDACSPSLSTNIHPSLQGVKVPDEDLTPRQRQHREVKLATIRKMHQMLFPEDQSIDGNSAIDITHNMPTQQLNVPSTNQSHLDWMKLQRQFSEDSKLKSDQRSTTTPTTTAATTVAQSPVPIGPVSSGGGSRNCGNSGPRLQGPPPPYHQTQRSASVPIALQSPNPSSPNNPTSNLSLPSPRASSSSALNSPAGDPNRQQFGINRHNLNTGQSPTSQDSPTASSRLNNHSNPGTPVSSHLSPSVNNVNETNTSTHQSVDGMYGRTLQSMAAQKQLNTSTSCPTTLSSGGGKEPNLMPVPSPQQIQYLNTFEGQELIIQKQPNTSLKERNIISPPILDSGFSGNATDLPHSRISGPNTPTSLDVGPRFPPTPGVPPDGCRFQIPSPHTPTAVTGDKCQRLTGQGPTSAPGHSPQTAPGPTSDPLKGDLFPTPSPHMMDVVPRFPGPNASPGANKLGGMGGGGGFMNVSPSGGKPGSLDGIPNYGCVRGDNVPLNPNCTSSMAGNIKVSHFDPISSLAQMSQQLTNSVANSLNGQNNQGPGMMNFGSPTMHMIEMGGCHNMNDMDQNAGNMMGMGMQGPPPPHGFHPNSPMGTIRSLSPKLPGAFPNHMSIPRMMGRPPGPNPYNGANVQVKPNAPNTIQYLPAKSQIGNVPGPRGPPSLDFLQRFTNPLSNMDNKMPTQNLQYFPNCGPNNGPMPGGPGGPMPPPPPHMTHMDGGLPPDGGPMGPMMGGPLGNGGVPMMGPGGGVGGGNGPGGGGNMGIPGGMMPMMRGPMRPPGMMRMPPQMGFNGPTSGGPGGGGGPPPGPEQMFNPGPNMNNPNAQMFVSGPKGSPMGMGAPDASQPLPPSMGQNNTFKNSPFVGPTTTDPNYAQQYHNFQQQLYATGTRSQMGGQAMGPGPGPGPPHTQQPPYFTPK